MNILHKILIVMSFGLLGTSCFAQGQLSEAEIRSTAEKMENDWRFAFPIVRWMEDSQIFEHYISTAPMRCPEELQDVLNMSESCYQESMQILQLEKQIYRKRGAKKWEASLANYFKDPGKAREKIAAAHRNVEMYEKMAAMFPSIIEGMRNMTYNIPQGELVNFVFHSGGGMVRRPATHGELQRLKDGSYIALLDNDTFDQYDTVAVTKAQADEIRKLLIDGEVYKMPKYYDTPVLLLDGPSSHVSVEFTDGSYSCDSFPPSDWGGKNIGAVYNYLRKLNRK